MTGVVNLYLCWYGTLDTHGFPAIYFVGSFVIGQSAVMTRASGAVPWQVR